MAKDGANNNIGGRRRTFGLGYIYKVCRRNNGYERSPAQAAYRDRLTL